MTTFVSSAPFINRIALYQVRQGISGVLGSGASTPISAAFSGSTDAAKLAAAQAVFPHVTALTDELEWAVAQGQVNKAYGASIAGGVLEVDPGTFVFNGKSLLKHSGVSFRGSGLTATVFKRLDAGTVGDCVIYCDNRDVGPNDGFLRDFAVATTSQYQTLGTLPSNIDGIQLGAHTEVSNVSGYGCRRFISLKGDHNQLRNLRGKGNGFAIYFDDPPPAIFGNLNILGLETDYSTIAVIGVHPRAAITSVYFVGGSSAIDTSPFAFYKEIDPSVSGGNSILFADAILDNIQMEQIGNQFFTGGAPLTGPSSVQGTARPEIHNLRMRECQFSYGDPSLFKVSGWSRDYAFDASIAEGWILDGIAAAHIATPGEKGMFCIQQPVSVQLKGDIEQLLTNVVSNAGKDFFTTSPGAQVGPDAGMSITLDHQGIWQGEVLAGYQLARGQLVQGAVKVGSTGGTPADGPLGVAMMGAGFFTGVAVARRGRVSYVQPSGAAGTTPSLYSAAGGTVSGQPGGRYVGEAINSTNAVYLNPGPTDNFATSNLRQWTTATRPATSASVVIGFNTDLQLLEAGVNGSWLPMTSPVPNNRPSMTLTNAQFETVAPIPNSGSVSLKGGAGSGTATIPIPTQNVTKYFRFQSKGGTAVSAGTPFLQIQSPSSGPTIDVGFNGNALTVGFGGNTTTLANIRDGAAHEVEVAWTMYNGLCFVNAIVDGTNTSIAQNSNAGNLAVGNVTLLYTGSRLATGDLLDDIEIASGNHTGDTTPRPVPVSLKSDTLMLLRFENQTGVSS